MTRRLPLIAQVLNLALFGALFGALSGPQDRTGPPRHPRPDVQSDDPRRYRRRSGKHDV